MEEVHLLASAPLTPDWSFFHSSIQPIFIEADYEWSKGGWETLAKVKRGQGGRDCSRQKEAHLQSPRGKHDAPWEHKEGLCGQGSGRERGEVGQGDMFDCAESSGRG